jgi:dimethylamine monooxygenase subunit A
MPAMVPPDVDDAMLAQPQATNDSAERGAPYLPFAPPFRLSLGLMPLSEADWLEVGPDIAARLKEKRDLLAAHHDEVFAALPAATAPSAELLAVLEDHLARHHPALLSGEDGLHPLDRCGRLVAEDFCLLVEQEGRLILAGASLSAPARWRLAEKLGRPVAALHAPVPGYDTALARPVDRFLAHLREGRLAWRLNWGILDHPARCQPAALHGSEPITAANAGAQLWLRVERQTFRKLHETGAIVFAIGTHITRLDRAIAAAAEATALAELIRTMPADMLHYKKIAPFAEPLLAWLEARIRA